MDLQHAPAIFHVQMNERVSKAVVPTPIYYHNVLSPQEERAIHRAGGGGGPLRNIASAHLHQGRLSGGLCGGRKVVAFAITLTKEGNHLDGAAVLAASIGESFGARLLSVRCIGRFLRYYPSVGESSRVGEGGSGREQEVYSSLRYGVLGRITDASPWTEGKLDCFNRQVGRGNCRWIDPALFFVYCSYVSSFSVGCFVYFISPSLQW